jgi:hypothetical protein
MDTVVQDVLIACPGVQRGTVWTRATRWTMPAHEVGRPLEFRLVEVDDWGRSGGAGQPDHGSKG